MAEGSDRQVELTTAPQGFRLDISGDLAEQVQGVRALVPWPIRRGVCRGVERDRGGLGDTPGGRPLPRRDASGRRARRFITDDKRLLVMCSRLREEHGFPIVAMNLADYLRQRRA